MAMGIFISYRRQDALAHARAVYERLRAEFGADSVFIDLEGLGLGEDFVESLDRQLAQCQVMLVLIGPQWLQARDSRGRRRLELAHDFVRLELLAALARPGVRVVPVLIDGTELPTEDDLPAELHPLLRRQALPLRFASFDADAGHLVAGLRRLPGRPSAAGPATPSTPVPAAPPAPRAPAALKPIKPTRAAWASDQGDDRYGHWAEFVVGGVVQRLRWIVPGEFLMGSPDDEPERDPVEGPQRRVRITRGFWLADTTCTQALWLAVMGGDNPSRFQGDPERPVEQVDHDDALRFLARLRHLLGADADPLLPTEAQWEYACRAGTDTPFSFGAQVDTDQVNCDGNFPYDGGAKGSYRAQTVAVRSLPANPWGLYEVHGNVWEWCADGGLAPYQSAPDGQAVDDPFNPPDDRPRAWRMLRGGSWVRYAHFLRSASRRAEARDFKADSIGFRLLLTHAGNGSAPAAAAGGSAP